MTKDPYFEASHKFYNVYSKIHFESQENWLEGARNRYKVAMKTADKILVDYPGYKIRYHVRYVTAYIKVNHDKPNGNTVTISMVRADQHEYIEERRILKDKRVTEPV